MELADSPMIFVGGPGPMALLVFWGVDTARCGTSALIGPVWCFGRGLLLVVILGAELLVTVPVLDTGSAHCSVAPGVWAGAGSFFGGRLRMESLWWLVN